MNNQSLKDPYILLSYLNSMLRDHYSNLDSLMEDQNLDKAIILKTLSLIDYYYNPELNQFISR